MKVHAETQRLLMRDLKDEDAAGIYALDSDPEVHRYLGKNPIKTIEEATKVIAFIRKQYKENGIGRWAVIEKENGNFIGWSGFKLITTTINGRTQYLDLGYRFIKKYWGKGYATETALASLEIAFNALMQEEVCAMADTQNLASNRILQKIGMSKLNEFTYEGSPTNFYSLSKTDWQKTTKQ